MNSHNQTIPVKTKIVQHGVPPGAGAEHDNIHLFASPHWWQRLAVMVVMAVSMVSVMAQTTVVWQDDFESPTVWNNWSVDNGVWDIGAPLTGPVTNSVGLRALQGTNCAASVLDGSYPASSSSRLIRNSAFVVPSASQNPRIQFWHWYEFSGNSYGVVQIKSGTNAWTDLSPRYYATGGGVWTRPVVDLKAYAGKAVQIAFQIATDGNVADGWCVDEVRFVKGNYAVGFTSNAVEGFELGLGDWSADTGTWEVGVPTSGPGAAHGGSNCLATVLGGNYEDDSSSRFISPPFVVPGADQLPRLRFWEWWNIGGHDFVQVQIKVGTNAWQALGDSITLDSFDRWTRAWHDLTPYAGQTVQLGFYFESHGYTYYDWWGTACWGLDPGPGWYVDDVTIETGPMSPIVFPETFENGWGGWQVDYIGGRVTDFGIWQIGGPTYGPPTNSMGSRAHSGANCAATVLDGDYPDDRSARLISPPFVVPQVGAHPALRFWHWFSIGGHDFCEIQIKTATNAWQTLTRYNPADSAVWTQVPPFDLSSFAGQTVQFGFYFESHGYTYYDWWGAAFWGLDPAPGWYVDDVTVSSANPPSGIIEFTDARYFVNECDGNATITVERKLGTNGSVCVDYMVSDGSAISGEDFDAVVDTLCWADGEGGVKSFTVPITQDTLVEGNETVSLTLSVPGEFDSLVARKAATLVIIDDDGPQPMITNIAYLRSLVATTNWVPTNTMSLFTVDGTVTTYTNLSSAPADELFFMQDGTNGIAVLFRNGTNQFMPQAGDRVRVTATLTNINGLLALAPDDNNLTNVVWRLSSGNALPTPATLDFAARTNVPAMEAMEARYVSASQVWISQPAGSSFPTVLTNLAVTNLAGRSFDLTINPNTDIAGNPIPAGPLTILGVLNQNDPTAPYTTNYSLLPTRYADLIPPQTNPPGTLQFVSTNALVLESGGTLGLTVSRTGGSSGAVGVTFATANGTALAGSDYGAANGILSWADGEGGLKTITVTVLNDAVAETDEFFTVGLSGATGGATLSNATAWVTVVNDDCTVQPASQMVAAGSSTSFSITPAASVVSLQWWKAGVVKPGATSATLNLTNVQRADAGNYSVVITTTAGVVTSSAGALIVNSPPAWTSVPVTSMSPGQQYVYPLQASDPDGDALTFQAVTLPSWLTLDCAGGGSLAQNVVAGSSPADVIAAQTLAVRSLPTTLAASYNEARVPESQYFAGEGQMAPTVQSQTPFDTSLALSGRAAKGLPKGAGNSRVSVSPLATQFPDISLFVTVLDTNGSSVTGLPQAAFQIQEQSSSEATPTTETLTSFQAATTPAGISFSLVCDVSGSMASYNKLEDAKAAAIRFLTNCTGVDRGNLVTFSSGNEISLVQASDWVSADSDHNGTNNLTQAILGLYAMDNTALFDGTATGITSLSQEPTPKAVIVFTDGLANDDRVYNINTVITKARNEGVPIYTIGLGADADTTTLQILATNTGGSFHYAPTAQDMAAVYAAIAREVRSTYLMHYTTHNPSYDGTLRTVAVSANGATGLGSYQVDFRPIVTLNPATLALGSNSQTAGTALNIGGTVKDLDAAAQGQTLTATLYYQVAGAGSFSSLAMPLSLLRAYP